MQERLSISMTHNPTVRHLGEVRTIAEWSCLLADWGGEAAE
jgi:hypothetical protein